MVNRFLSSALEQVFEFDTEFSYGLQIGRPAQAVIPLYHPEPHRTAGLAAICRAEIGVYFNLGFGL
jgi:hypothetical protein